MTTFRSERRRLSAVLFSLEKPAAAQLERVSAKQLGQPPVG